MAYDPKDAKDVALVAKMVDDALAEQKAEHDTELAGLKTNRDTLLKEVKTLKKKIAAGTDDPEALQRLETELDTTKEALTKAQGELKTATKEHGKAVKSLETETEYNRKLLVDGGLTQELVKANVPKEFLPAVRSLLQPKVQVVTKDGERKAMVGDKELGAYVVEWSQGDEGKHYVAAKVNGGSGASGGGAKGSAKSVARAVFDQMSPADRMAHAKDGGIVT